MTDFKKLLEKAKEIETKVKESQDNIKKIRVEGHSGGDAVKVILNGEGEMLQLVIDDKIFKENKDIIIDLIIAAHNNAKSNLQTKPSY